MVINQRLKSCEIQFKFVVAVGKVFAFAATFVATFFAGRRQIAVGLSAFAVLFAGHALVPDLAIVSFGKRWYLGVYTLFFALIPAMVGAAAATLARRREDS